MTTMQVNDVQQALNKTGSSVAILLVFLLGAAIGILLTRPVPDANMNVLLVLLGALATNITNIVQYFFGSTANNKQKDATIATLTAAAAPNTTTTTTTKTDPK